MEMSRKHLINHLGCSVRENLIGCVLRNENLQIFEDINVVVHKECFRRSKKVIIISGGGSGHEPLAAGYIGDGFLTAAVAGNIFSAPSSRCVLKAIRRLASINDNEVLLIVMNYTGDRLTFGLARERAILEKFKVSFVLFGDDCAFRDRPFSVGRRGLAGGVLLFKLAGALNDGSRSAEEIKSELDNFSKLIHTISVSLTPCNIPGVGISFQLSTDEMELGLGIHGEAGVARAKLVTAKEVVGLMWNYVESDFTTKSGSVVVLINNLGGLSNFELNIFNGESLRYIQSKGFKVERIYCGTFVTSFNMSGVSLTVLEANDKILSLLDTPGVCDAWQCQTTKRNILNTSIICGASKTVEEEENEEKKFDEVFQLPFANDVFLEAVSAACKKLIESESFLNELDSIAGDSDCGSTLASGCRTVLNSLELNNLHPSFGQLARISETVMGGTTGAVYSLLFAGALSVLTSQSQWLNKVDFWSKCVARGMENISKYGLAKVGDRTLLDALNAICEVLDKNKYSESYVYLAKEVAKHVDEAANATATMKAKAGRASYVDSKLITKPDPGAKAVAIWVNAIASVITVSCKELCV